MNNEKKTQNKPLSFYLNRHYPTTFYPDDEGGFTVIIPDLPGCMTQGDTAEEAFEMIAEAKELWIASAYEDNVPIPPPSTEIAYSGKTMLRMPKYLHARLAESAKQEGVSLNQYLVALLSERDALTVNLTAIKAVQGELANLCRQLEGKARFPGQASRSPYLVSENEPSVESSHPLTKASD
jgi:antitoxin HicB